MPNNNSFGKTTKNKNKKGKKSPSPTHKDPNEVTIDSSKSQAVIPSAATAAQNQHNPNITQEEPITQSGELKNFNVYPENIQPTDSNIYTDYDIPALQEEVVFQQSDSSSSSYTSQQTSSTIKRKRTGPSVPAKRTASINRQNSSANFYDKIIAELASDLLQDCPRANSSSPPDNKPDDAATGSHSLPATSSDAVPPSQPSEDITQTHHSSGSTESATQPNPAIDYFPNL